MAATLGHMEAFDESVEPWTTYIERFEHFVEASSIDADKKVPVLLSVTGGKTYGLLRSLTAPDKPREKSFKHITDTLQQHFSPKPLIIVECFRFHRQNQEESESVTQSQCRGTYRNAASEVVHNPRDQRSVHLHVLQYALRPKVEAELNRLTEMGVLLPVQYSEWATPIVPVVKKNGAMHICGDFKVMINPVLYSEHYPLPRIEDLFASLAGGQCFSKLDLSHAYLQMRVEKESTKFFTISTQKGLFQYNRLPFGIASAPAIFQRAMDQVLLGLPNVHCYLDDILVTGRTEAEHLENLDAVLGRLEEFGLHVEKGKCDFFKDSLEYLDHIIVAEGLHKSPEKVSAIVNAPTPSNITQLRSFLGLLNYYGRFIPNLATIANPLNALLCKGKRWQCSAECEAAFKKAKEQLVSQNVLTHYDPQNAIRLACDTSPYGIGAVISHMLPSGEKKPIAFASRTLSKAEQNYAQIECEALAIVFGVRKFHQYLYGWKFTLFTDHRPLTMIFGPQNGIPSMVAARMQRQVEKLPASATDIRCETMSDSTLSTVVEMVLKGTQAVSLTDNNELSPFITKRNELSVQHGCLMRGMRVVVLHKLRKRVLEDLHTGHPGIVQMKAIARSCVWWSGLADNCK
ncbi:uncharacterized protein K02A2.6-like [Pangasianodon hypophthalmus]|uniref:uncharacterized protein K02A2.6-like n=1 Tax=Pangasianodon hypophthalmus TaxID=310915 RepID=UPI00230743EC|nr:uncharacterized protein K02A2.6-like [Pangasianodon hypophthalmus]